MTDKVNFVFIANARAAIDEMRAAGMSEPAIAGALCDIRAAAIHEERLRVQVVDQTNPPGFPTWIQMRDLIAPDAHTAGKHND